jgi:hypothetical protein
MRHINSPEEPEQKLLFDAELGTWWHTQLTPEGLRQLSEGTEGVMRRNILKLLPAEKLGEYEALPEELRHPLSLGRNSGGPSNNPMIGESATPCAAASKASTKPWIAPPA